VEAFSHLEFAPLRDGTHRMSGALEPRLALPFMRALMRVEADLLLRDADRLVEPDDRLPTSPQRTSDPDDLRRLDPELETVDL
jgi:hypothetical protein